MLIEISTIKGNSGAGSPVFSKPGLMHNTFHMAFNKESKPRKPQAEDPGFDFRKWKDNIKEIEVKEQFKRAYSKFDGKAKRAENLDRLQKLGYSKSVVPKDTIDEVKPKPQSKRIVPLIGDIKKDKLKNSMGMSNEEREKAADREVAINRNRGQAMSEIQVPGPGAYKPKFTQQDGKSDRVSHALQTQQKRFTYFDEFAAVEKEKNEHQTSAELGCCDRLMRGLANIKEMGELQEDRQPSPSGGASRQPPNLEEMKHRTEMQMKKKQAEQRHLYCPNDTQYQRTIQNISSTMQKTKQSQISPKNKLVSKAQAFGNTGQRDDFKGKRETTLGYFSVFPPFDQGASCTRFNARSTNASPPVTDLTMMSPYSKADLKKEIARVTERASNLSMFELNQQALRATDYSNRSNKSPWINQKMSGKEMKNTSMSINEELSQQEMRNSRQNQRVNDIQQAHRLNNVAISEGSSFMQEPTAAAPFKSEQSVAENLRISASKMSRKVSFDHHNAALRIDKQNTDSDNIPTPTLPQQQTRQVIQKTVSGMAVNEIQEIENDESPNRRAHKRLMKKDSMGFQPDGGIHVLGGSDNKNGPSQYDGFEDAAFLPLNINYSKTDHMFGVTNSINKQTNYTSFNNRSGSLMNSSGPLDFSTMEREANVTNYETAIAWGKLGLRLEDPHRYEKSMRNPAVHYQTARPSPVVLSVAQSVTNRATLPLVNHPGSLASKRKWDDKGALIIQKHTSPRFAADSYLGEKPFLDAQGAEPLPIGDANRTFNRSPKHIFPGIKKPLDTKFLDDKKSLFKSIIQGKQKPAAMQEFIKLRKQQSEPAVKKRLRRNTEDAGSLVSRGTAFASLGANTVRRNTEDEMQLFSSKRK